MVLPHLIAFVDFEILDLEVHPLTWWVDQFASGGFKCKVKVVASSAKSWLSCLRSALALAVPIQLAGYAKLVGGRGERKGGGGGKQFTPANE